MELSVRRAAVTVRAAFVAAHAATTVQGDFENRVPVGTNAGRVDEDMGKETGGHLPRTLVQDPRVG
jgi:hypothetical protein